MEKERLLTGCQTLTPRDGCPGLKPFTGPVEIREVATTRDPEMHPFPNPAMSTRIRRPVLVKDYRPPRPRGSRKPRPIDPEKRRRDFWLLFPLEKFAMDWRRAADSR